DRRCGRLQGGRDAAIDVLDPGTVHGRRGAARREPPARREPLSARDTRRTSTWGDPGRGRGITRAGEALGPRRRKSRGMDTTSRSARLLLVLAAVSSLVSAVLGVCWLLGPAGSPLGHMAAPPPLLDLLGPGPLYGAQVMVALLGAATGAALLAMGAVPA